MERLIIVHQRINLKKLVFNRLRLMPVISRVKYIPDADIKLNNMIIMFVDTNKLIFIKSTRERS